jgi:tetratricopeptide (TPR) repeat protein
MGVMRTLVILVALSGIARADDATEPQPPPPPPPTQKAPAAVAFDEGRALLDANQPKAACEKFEQSLELEPEALGTLLNLGLCNEQQDKMATALRWFRRAQARASELHKPDSEEAAKDRTSALASKVATLKIAFASPPPTGTAVTLDGAPLAAVDYNRIEIDAGDHVVATTAPGMLPARDPLTIADGASRTITIKLTAPTFAVIDRGARLRKRAYIVGGVGAALLIGDTVLALVAKHEYDDTDELASRAHWKNAARYGATSMFVAGSAAIGVALYWYLTAPGKERTIVAPGVAGDRVSLWYVRTF